MTGRRAQVIVLATGRTRAVDYNHDPPDADCKKCTSGCDYCQDGIIPWEWSIDWDALAAERE
jgi:hypothetical protein